MSKDIPIGVAVADLRPTQMTVGLHEVAAKRRRWRDADKHDRAILLRRHVLPAVIGPKGRRYITDHHHFARALLDEGAKHAAVYVLADLSHLPKQEFWTFLDNSAWCHPYDAAGKRRRLRAIPKHLSDLADDPYRSLAGALIRAGGCAKTNRPFAEFLWADHLRRRIDPVDVRKDWDAAVDRALRIARSDEARCLPGWCGANPAGL
ncbi:ParB-like protein [Sphingomonas sp. XXL09]|uniref:ParB-like protein n=1 Tax=Sphingomonas sp. XXL09 TaxID=3457787 RepID=UPI00406BC3F4